MHKYKTFIFKAFLMWITLCCFKVYFCTQNSSLCMLYMSAFVKLFLKFRTFFSAKNPKKFPCNSKTDAISDIRFRLFLFFIFSLENSSLENFSLENFSLENSSHRKRCSVICIGDNDTCLSCRCMNNLSVANI